MSRLQTCEISKATAAASTVFILDFFRFYTNSVSIRLNTKEKSLEAERRVHPRHSVRDDKIEVFGREANVIGKLENISTAGLAFYYTPRKGQKTEAETIDIMATGPARFYLSGLSCRIVYDISALDEDHTFTGAETRLCGVEFVRLENNLQLSFFLRNFLKLPSEDPLLS